MFSTTTVAIPIHPHVGQNVPLPTEPTEQTPLTPTASAAVDIKKTAIFDVHAIDDNDEPWASVTDHRTGWNKEFKSGTYRCMLYGIDCFARLSETSCISACKKCMNHSIHCRTQNRLMQRVFSQRFERAFHQVDVQDRWYRSEGRTSSVATRPSLMFSSTRGSHRKQRTHTKDILCRLWNVH